MQNPVVGKNIVFMPTHTPSISLPNTLHLPPPFSKFSSFLKQTTPTPSSSSSPSPSTPTSSSAPLQFWPPDSRESRGHFHPDFPRPVFSFFLKPEQPRRLEKGLRGLSGRKGSPQKGLSLRSEWRKKAADAEAFEELSKRKKTEKWKFVVELSFLIFYHYPPPTPLFEQISCRCCCFLASFHFSEAAFPSFRKLDRLKKLALIG